MAGNQVQFTHNIFRNDPLLFKSYVNKKVTVLTEDGNRQTGIVYTVDPVSESIILIQPEETTYRIKIIMGHAVKNIELSSDPETILPELFSAPVTKISEIPKTVISDRKNAIKEELLKNRFPFTENNDIIQIEDVLFIKPPYELENFVSNNSTILNRVQTILSAVIK